MEISINPYKITTPIQIKPMNLIKIIIYKHLIKNLSFNLTTSKETTSPNMLTKEDTSIQIIITMRET